MPEPAVVAFHAEVPVERAITDVTDVCTDIGFEVVDVDEEMPALSSDGYRKLDAEREDWSLSFQFTLTDREPGDPLFLVSVGHNVYPDHPDDDGEYRDRMGTIFEIVCRLATALEADYVSLMTDQNDSIVPEDRPIGEHLDDAPTFGVYAPALLERLGGPESIAGSQPWYTATLETGHSMD